jgi:PucR family transcriptional regulator, purine catabolism regulatory protein
MWARLTVDNVLAVILHDARVAGGAEGATRWIDRARVAGSTGALRRVVANEFVVSTVPALAATGETWDQLFARLDAAHVAALAVSDEARGMPVGLVAAANRLSLPLIVLPSDAPLGEVAAKVSDALVEVQRSRLDRILEVQQRFAHIVLAGGGPAEVAATLQDLLGCTVAILDARGRQVVVVPSDGIDDGARGTAPRVVRPIRAGDEDYGQIVALTDALDDDGHLALERASMALAMRYAQASAVAEAEERFAGITLEELVSGHATDAAEVLERAMSFGWDLDRPRAVLLASLDPPVEQGIAARALATIAAAARATLGAEAIVWTRSATVAALIAPRSDEPSQRRELALALQHELDECLHSVTVSIGVGCLVGDPLALPQSMKEASRAVDVGRWAKGRHVTELFDELGLERLLAICPPEELTHFVRHAIGPLIDHDRDHGSDLVETLAAWLDTRNMAEASRRVHVHYNTMKNRLERIESILGPVVADANRALECEVATYVVRHYGVGSADEAGTTER